MFGRCLTFLVLRPLNAEAGSGTGSGGSVGIRTGSYR